MIRMKSDKSTMVFLVVFLLGLLAAREVFASSNQKLPDLKTAAAQKLLAGFAEPGQSFRVKNLYTFDSGERFAQVEINRQQLWLRLEEGQSPRIGEDFSLTSQTYLFREPIVEEEATPDIDPGVWPLGGQSRHPFHPGKLGANSACTKFIGSDGTFGPWGSYLMSKLNSSEHPNFFSAQLGDLSSVCPKFQGMNSEERKNFWVWLIASMANYESSCNEKVKAKGVNGTAAGLLQLHLGKEQNYGCRSGINSLNAKDNLECGLTILNRDLKRTGKIFPGRNNYWQVLRPQSGPGARTLRMTRKYQPCF